MCLKCIFRAGSLLDVSVLLCSVSNKGIPARFPQALLSPAVIYMVIKIKTSNSWSCAWWLKGQKPYFCRFLQTA